MADSDIDIGERLRPTPVASENGLVRAAGDANSNDLSIEEIVHRHHREVRGFLARFLGNDASVDDVAQEVFVQVHRSLDKFTGQGSLRSWIFGIARHQVGTWFRKQSRQIRFRGLDVESDLTQYRWQQWQQDVESASVADGDNDLDDLELMRGCLEKLKPSHRSMVQRFYFEGVTAEAIGQQDGRASGAVRMALMRIRESLATCIRRQRARRNNNE